MIMKSACADLWIMAQKPAQPLQMLRKQVQIISFETTTSFLMSSLCPRAAIVVPRETRMICSVFTYSDPPGRDGDS